MDKTAKTDEVSKNIFYGYAEAVTKAIPSYIEGTGSGTELGKAVEYCLTAPGKRIRPALTLAFSDIFGVDCGLAMPYAVALEMIHTYSLVHDDMPCMDDDDLRRGRPTCHKVFGEANALLCGDALLNRAFEIVFEAAVRDGRCGAAAGRELARLAGTEGMLGGQALDIANENTEAGPDVLLETYRLKTSALLECAAAVAVELARENGRYFNSSEEEFENAAAAAVSFTRNLGLAFQIKDDLLDITGDPGTLGKPVGSDERDSKRTYVAAVGAEKAARDMESYTEKAVEAAAVFGERGRILRWLAAELLDRKH